MGNGTGNLLFELHIGDVPTQWQRTRGKTRYTHQSYRSWSELLKQIAQEEVEMVNGGRFPLTTPCRVSVLVLYDGPDKFPDRMDLDNVLKGILDSLSKVVWYDDSLRYIRAASICFSCSRHESTTGTHIFVYSI